MADQLPKRSERSDAPKPLPRNKDALATILRVLEKFLEFHEPCYHSLNQQVREMRKTLASPETAHRKLPFQEAIAKAANVRSAAGGPAFTAVVPYVDSAVLRPLLEERRAIESRLVDLARQKPSTLNDFQPLVEAYAKSAEIFGKLIEPFRELSTIAVATWHQCWQSDLDRLIGRFVIHDQ